MVDQYHKEYAASNNDSNHHQKKKGFNLKEFVKIYKSVIALRSWNHRKKSSSKDVPNSQGSGKEMDNEDTKGMKGVGKHRNKGDESRREDSRGSASLKRSFFSFNNHSKFSFSFSRTKSKSTSSSHSHSHSRSRSPSPSPNPSPTLSSSSRSRNGSPSSTSSDKVSNNNINGFPDNLSKSSSRRHGNSVNNTNGNNPNIMFSNSPGIPHDRELECTLEELCFGCTKTIKIDRDVRTDSGIMVQEEEVLSIEVEPGWKEGTRITFPGAAGAVDVTFVIAEKMHNLFKREGDDLELVIEVPLVQALTGCTILIPLLGGQAMSLTIDDVIYPGYRKIIPGQDMPNSKDQNGRRGSLKVSFLVKFPAQLTDEQRGAAVRALTDSCG